MFAHSMFVYSSVAFENFSPSRYNTPRMPLSEDCSRWIPCELIERKLGYSFRDRGLLLEAFVHRSYTNEHVGSPLPHNERFEFLGDRVLGLICSSFLFKTLSDLPEGELTHLCSQVVDARACAQYMQSLGVDEYFLLGKGERMNREQGRFSICANGFEALMGAIFLDGGWEAAEGFFLSHFSDLVQEKVHHPQPNAKSEIQHFCQSRWGITPTYTLIKEEGPPHCRTFWVSLSAHGQVLAQGKGNSKKGAEQDAASHALEQYASLMDNGKNHG